MDSVVGESTLRYGLGPLELNFDYNAYGAQTAKKHLNWQYQSMLRGGGGGVGVEMQSSSSSSSSSSSVSLSEDEEQAHEDGKQSCWWQVFSGYALAFEEELRSCFPDDLTMIPWTHILYWVRGLPVTSPLLRRQKELIFDTLCRLFVETATPLAKRIIDESFSSSPSSNDGHARLKPDPKFGGFAGGQKYCVGTLLFKFATDVELSSGSWLYGGSQRNDFLARKSAGHELKSTQALLDAGMTQLNFAMMATFMYRGLRVTCASLLPVKGARALVQGKENVHSPMRVPPPHVEAVMAAILGGSLRIGKNPKPGQEIYGPFDLEVHMGADGLLYIIDPARLFPPEYRGPQSVGNNVFYQLLRPELLQKQSKLVLPDALQLRDETALQDLVELSQSLDREIETLGHELKQGKQIRCLRFIYLLNFFAKKRSSWRKFSVARWGKTVVAWPRNQYEALGCCPAAHGQFRCAR